MQVSAPFRLSHEDVVRARLQPSDIGTWCVLANGCYHLFGSEALARRAYEKMLEGEMVR